MEEREFLDVMQSRLLFPRGPSRRNAPCRIPPDPNLDRMECGAAIARKVAVFEAPPPKTAATGIAYAKALVPARAIDSRRTAAASRQHWQHPCRGACQDRPREWRDPLGTSKERPSPPLPSTDGVRRKRRISIAGSELPSGDGDAPISANEEPG